MLRGIEHQERAGSISALDIARGKACLPDESRLLIAGNSADGQRLTEHRGIADSEISGTVANLGQHAHGHVEHLAQRLVPTALANVVERGSARIGGIGEMRLAAAQPPDEKTVDGAEGDVAGGGRLARTRHSVEDPRDLGGGEIRVEAQAGLAAHVGLAMIESQLPASIRGAAILPDNGVVNGRAAATIPENGGFSLIGDADGGNRSPAPRRAAAIPGGWWTGPWPRSLRRHARPNPKPDKSARSSAARQRSPRPRPRRRWHAWNSFPGRWRAKCQRTCSGRIAESVRYRPRTLSADTRPHSDYK